MNSPWGVCTGAVVAVPPAIPRQSAPAGPAGEIHSQSIAFVGLASRGKRQAGQAPAARPPPAGARPARSATVLRGIFSSQVVDLHHQHNLRFTFRARAAGVPAVTPISTGDGTLTAAPIARRYLLLWHGAGAVRTVRGNFFHDFASWFNFKLPVVVV